MRRVEGIVKLARSQHACYARWMATDRGDSLSPEQLRQIDELCEAMDREFLWARMRTTEEGRTPLEHCRALWTQRAKKGLPLPDRWCRDEEEEEVQRRNARYGTREWRKAFPEIVEIVRRRDGETQGGFGAQPDVP